MDTEEYFDRMAPFYDSIVNARYKNSTSGDPMSDKVGFYVDEAKQAEGPVLEIGCGTGHVYLELLREEVDAFGIDISDRMLEKLRSRAADSGLDANVRQADMRSFEPQREYELVIIPGRGFLHNTTLDDQRQTLENIHDALAPGGRLICNFLTPNFASISDDIGASRELTFQHDGRSFTMEMRDVFEDKITQIIRGERMVRDDQGETVIDYTYRIKLVTRDEFELLLENTGYSDRRVYGGFDREQLASPDQEMVWVASVENGE